jgi:uncharacterized repeat protein (TIGR04138 family)
MCSEENPLEAIVKADPRYAPGAYHFIFEALAYTQKMLGIDEAENVADRHVSGGQLVEGIRRLALEQFGPLAITVFSSWGLHKTGDFGELVFNLVSNELMSKTDEDTPQDFCNIYDFEAAFRRGYKISVDVDSI